MKLRLIKSEKLPLINLRILLKGGDIYEPADKIGIAGITARLLQIGGTQNLKPEQIDKMKDAKGIRINFDSRTNYFTITLTCLVENFDEAMGLMAKLILEPAFDAEKMEEVKTQYSSNIARRNDEPGDISNREFKKLIYGEKSPLSAVLEYEHLDNITREDVIKYYRQFFAPANILAGVSGPIEMDAFKKVMEKHLGNWNARASVPAYPQIKGQSPDFKIGFSQKDSLNQSYLVVGHIGIKKDPAKMAKIKVFNAIFSDGFSSRLMMRVRTQMGATYGIGGEIETPRLYPGMTSFDTFTKSGSTIAAIKAIHEEAEKIRNEKVTQKELDVAKNSFLNSFVFQFSNPEQILRNSLTREFYGEPEDSEEKLIEDIRTVTAEDVQKVAQELLHPDKMVVYVVGNAKDMDGKLSDLGKVKEIDISIKPPALKEKIPAATPETLAKGADIMKNLLNTTYKGYKKLKTLKEEGTFTMSMGGRSMQIEYKSNVIFPGKIHRELSVMGMKMQQVYNGDKGYMNQMGQKVNIPKEQIEDELFSDFYHLFRLQDRYQYQYLKEVEEDGKTFDVLYVFNEKKKWVKLFINKATNFIEKMEQISKQPGASGIMQVLLSDIEVINGVPSAKKTSMFVKDKKVMEIVVKKTMVNPTVDPALFKIEK